MNSKLKLNPDKIKIEHDYEKSDYLILEIESLRNKKLGDKLDSMCDELEALVEEKFPEITLVTLGNLVLSKADYNTCDNRIRVGIISYISTTEEKYSKISVIWFSHLKKSDLIPAKIFLDNNKDLVDKVKCIGRVWFSDNLYEKWESSEHRRNVMSLLKEYKFNDTVKYVVDINLTLKENKDKDILFPIDNFVSILISFKDDVGGDKTLKYPIPLYDLIER